ncbi:MAG: NAD-dependent epimerase/dehydratase family protein [Rhodothermales bacterium]|nr:NAD-dependent epimerase/dehydratase family protein [Rhodothermales bacterium]
MKVLFVGGTGIISSACARLAIDRGIELYLLNRGQSSREVPAGAHVLRANIYDWGSADAALGDHTFDAVVNWVAFVPENVESDLDLFRDRTGQYIFISSASVYQTPPAHLPITESTPLYNPFWEYSRNKIACEERLMRACREEGFPVTIVRPSHTYDERAIPLHGGYTAIDRMRNGRKIIVHGDGSSLWVLTHHRDFAKGFVGLLGHAGAIGHAVHITSDELLTWDQIAHHLARAAGAAADIVHVPSDVIARHDPDWGASLLGDKTHSMIFDNTKIKRLVPGFEATIPFARGAEEILSWYDGDASRRVVDQGLNDHVDRILAAVGA